MARRRFRSKPEPLARRNMPLCIECLDGRAGPTKASIGNETYWFTPDASGRKVALVAIELHIECFLARADMYRVPAAI